MSVFATGIPEDFDDFWQLVADEAASVRLDYHRFPLIGEEAQLLPAGFDGEKIEFLVTGNRTLNGWIVYPAGVRRSPGFVWLAPYGRESLLPNQYGTRTGMASLSFNFFGHPAFHQEKYTRERGYFAEGISDPDTWIFRQMICDAMVAARVFQAQIEVNEDRIGAMGLSQGAGLSIALGAWSPVIQAVCADMPFLGGIAATLAGPVYRYPLKEITDYTDREILGMERVVHTLSYFDTIHLATRCRRPTQVSLGLKDPACRPESVRSIYQAIAGPKQLIEYDWGHDWHPDMVENDRNWLLHSMES